MFAAWTSVGNIPTEGPGMADLAGAQWMTVQSGWDGSAWRSGGEVHEKNVLLGSLPYFASKGVAEVTRKKQRTTVGRHDGFANPPPSETNTFDRPKRFSRIGFHRYISSNVPVELLSVGAVMIAALFSSLIATWKK